MIYDYAIVGAGLAGGVCAYELSKKGKSCILFEKNCCPTEKICGGGVSYKAISKLQDIGINTDLLFKLNSKSIKGHRIIRNRRIENRTYKDGNNSLGIQRMLLDQYILYCAASLGSEIKYGIKVDCIKQHDNYYDIKGYIAKDVIWASGARNLYGRIIAGQSIGYSSQISAKSRLNDQIFYYWYFDIKSDEKYFWAFPIGENLWNVGVWSRHMYNDLKKEYNECLKQLFLKEIDGSWKYYREPKAEFLGHVDQRQQQSYFKNGIGDFAGKCNPMNGGGIIGAIDSAIEFAKRV